ncbi:hypothetical protein L1987_64410 [Smallanthus sonchifolius]|uniref:Uncharacterized protein n=1 Tax=Smallanthus sonchifolius TaxID=185202 RepID=A0ACB9CG79_9ASTR|nr:hypothetical protein L1987_64410 [Smallanthus sonchifolius]
MTIGIVEKLLIAAVADTDVSVRNSIFSSVHGNEGFDDFLAQADSLTAIFSALNDEMCNILLSRSHRPYVRLDVITRMTCSLLLNANHERKSYIGCTHHSQEAAGVIVISSFIDLEQRTLILRNSLDTSADSKCQEESAKLLGYLIRSCERLILPYIAPIHKALLTKLCEGTTGVNTNNDIISGVLVTVGDLARGGFAMREYIPELMPRIVEALLDGAAATKREVAVATLGQVVQSTGYVDCFNSHRLKVTVHFALHVMCITTLSFGMTFCTMHMYLLVVTIGY